LDNRGSLGAPGTVTCVYDDPAVAEYVFRVPAGVTDVHIAARGAAGGDGGTISGLLSAPEGGRGGLAAADFPVVAGDLLRVLVGGHSHDADGPKPGAGGANGGAQGGPGTVGGGGGGGSSSVRLGGTDWSSRILVAGGGGGAGGAMDSGAAAAAGGGPGGGERGENGRGDNIGKGGIGAVGPSGGAGLTRVTGLDGHSGYDEGFGGYGGEGGYGSAQSIPHSGNISGGPVGAGGGGGGYAGGSGGSSGATIGGGGGGGSGFVATSALAPSVARFGSAELSTGVQGGDGQVVISYQPVVTTTATASSESLAQRRTAQDRAGEGPCSSGHVPDRPRRDRCGLNRPVCPRHQRAPRCRRLGHALIHLAPISANTAATVYAIAERAAALIRG
jgi:hypothetical protein